MIHFKSNRYKEYTTVRLHFTLTILEAVRSVKGLNAQDRVVDFFSSIFT